MKYMREYYYLRSQINDTDNPTYMGVLSVEQAE